MSVVSRRIRTAVERALQSNAKLVRRVLVAAGGDRVRRLPEIVQIEGTNICNAKCVFCPRDDMRRRQGVMNMTLYRKIIDECAAAKIRYVRLHNYGEPFVDRELVEKILYAKRCGIPEVGLISNGSLITGDTAIAIIEAGLDAINISVDAGGKDVFESTRVGLSYDGVIANIERLVKLRSELGRRRPKLILSFVRRNNTEDERVFVERWRGTADKIHVTDIHNWAGALHHDSNVTFPCYRLWRTFTVLWDGRVSLCCADFDGREILGDMCTSTMSEIWNSESYRRVRRAHLQSGGPDICRSCDLPKKDSPLWILKGEFVTAQYGSILE